MPVRRRPPGEEWKDRTAADDPIEWIAQAWFSLPQGLMPARENDEEITKIASSTGAISWDAEELDGALADAERAQRAKQDGWFLISPRRVPAAVRRARADGCARGSTGADAMRVDERLGRGG